MSNTFTDLLGLTKQVTGENPDGVWGATFNEGVIDLIEDSISARAEIDVTAGTVTLTRVDGAADNARVMFIIANGTPAAARTIIVPSLQKMYIVSNESGQDLTVKTLLGTGPTINNGERVHVFVDGSIDLVQSVTIASSGGGSSFSPYASTEISVEVTIVGGSFPTSGFARFNKQGNIVRCIFQPDGSGQSVNDSSFIIQPTSGLFPYPPNEVVDYFGYMEEAATGLLIRAYARVSTDGSNIEWIKSDGSAWATFNPRNFFSVSGFPTIYYSIADLP